MGEKKVTKEETIITTYCDVCDSNAVPFSNRVQKCPICKKDVCGKCSIVTDHWGLSPGDFEGDYPDHYCKTCWDNGQEIISAIKGCRQAENELWDKWHKQSTDS